jgi:hypothetical protein
MREIWFRGKSVSDGKWVEGYFFAKPILEKYFIILGEEQWMVYPKSVGQYTNRRDKNGNRIFEGDIIRIPGSNKKGLPAQVWYNPYNAFFEIRRMGYNPLVLDASEEWAEVIGNIHDNPELLKV